MFTLHRSNRPRIVPVAGERSTSKLLNGVQTQFVNVRKTARVAITVAPVTAIRNRGSVQALFTEEGIMQGGNIVSLVDPRVTKFVSEASSGSDHTDTRLAAVAVATTTLVEHSRLYFAHPYAANPRETSFVERDPGVDLAYFCTLDPTLNGRNRLVEVGGATVVIDQISVTVQQGYDAEEGSLPLFLPTARQIVQGVPAANPELEVFVRTNNRIRAISILQEATFAGGGNAEVTDIINRVVLRGDRGFIIGPEFMPWDDLAREQEYEFGGDVYASTRGSHVHLNFQQWGRLSKVLDPLRQDLNLRFVFDAQPTAAAGATASSIKITLWELERDLYVDPATGRRVVTPSLPEGL